MAENITLTDRYFNESTSKNKACCLNNDGRVREDKNGKMCVG